MQERENRSVDEIMEDLQCINEEFQEKIRDGLKDPNHFLKLSEIERMGRELSLATQNLYAEETMALLREADEDMLLSKKKRISGKRNQSHLIPA